MMFAEKESMATSAAANDVSAAWVAHLHLDVDNRYVDRALGKLLSLDDPKLKAISAGTFFYSALLLTEGIGLWLKKRWAEYFTIIATCSFIPLELYEIAKRVNVNTDSARPGRRESWPWTTRRGGIPDPAPG